MWEPTFENPYRGLVIWPVPENIDIMVTLFRDHKATQFEDKEWIFVIEDVSFSFIYNVIWNLIAGLLMITNTGIGIR